MIKLRKTICFKLIGGFLIFLILFQADILISQSLKKILRKQFEMAKEEYEGFNYRIAKTRLERLNVLHKDIENQTADIKSQFGRILLLLGACYENLNQWDNAKEKYKTVVSEYPPVSSFIPGLDLDNLVIYDTCISHGKIEVEGLHPTKKKKKWLLWGSGVIALVILAVLFLKKKSKTMPQTGSIAVETIPDGADIWLNGNYTGERSNANLDNLSPGAYTVKLTKHGYCDHEAKVEIIGGLRVTHRVTLQVTNTPPTVVIKSPAKGVDVKRKITIFVNASDENGINRIIFYIDDEYKLTDKSAPYRYEWDTRDYKNGWHEIKVTAYDNSNKSASVEIKVKVDN